LGEGGHPSGCTTIRSPPEGTAIIVISTSASGSTRPVMTVVRVGGLPGQKGRYA
jgi:hypothetical protein